MATAPVMVPFRFPSRCDCDRIRGARGARPSRYVVDLFLGEGTLLFILGGATFPIFAKIEVNGDGASEIYPFLESDRNRDRNRLKDSANMNRSAGE